MKNLLLILCILGIHKNSAAQNTYPYPSSGNVGIGTNTPAATLSVLGSSSLTLPDASLSGIGQVDGQESHRAILNLNNVASPVSTISISSNAKWKVIFKGLWVNNYEGGGLSQPAPYIEITSEAPNIAIGIITLTISRDPGTGKLVGVTSSAVTEKSIGFSGTIDVISNNISAVGLNSLILQGNVGIGTTNPLAKLSVNGTDTGIEVTGSQRSRLNLITTDQLGWQIEMGNANGNGNQQAGDLGFTESGVSGGRLVLKKGGNVGIGTTTPAEKLSVNGKIRAHEVKVQITGWPDHVFEQGYELEKLEGLERFIKDNKHLPEIPSAAEVEKEGISLGEMNAKLLKKIEELTLYLIEQEKGFKELKASNEQLILKVNQLELKR